MFNLEAFALGCLVLVACVLIHALFLMFVAYRSKRELVSAVHKNQIAVIYLLFVSCVLLLLISHMAQIYLWGLALFYFNVIDHFHAAMVYAGSTYTTVGFVIDPLPLQWQLLSVIMAVSGIFSFAWSTSIMFSISQQLFKVQK
ncbi:hypothetical protein [Polynucleobacter sp. MWH-UH25E]|uniref:hypothetical protein n=1 Tax=Polynucleobacter sp. MWH-UH25E TaxID=1855616 RepID=UPI001BFDC7BB|nr:hypothetical protein [Polynucleobacter sp. MWH-UH25E]QWD62583.1 hypothetical protein ICV39_02915 [Polynucleobacter sp. MWH-UH25E]